MIIFKFPSQSEDFCYANFILFSVINQFKFIFISDTSGTLTNKRINGNLNYKVSIFVTFSRLLCSTTHSDRLIRAAKFVAVLYKNLSTDTHPETDIHTRKTAPFIPRLFFCRF